MPRPPPAHTALLHGTLLHGRLEVTVSRAEQLWEPGARSTRERFVRAVTSGTGLNPYATVRLEQLPRYKRVLKTASIAGTDAPEWNCTSVVDVAMNVSYVVVHVKTSVNVDQSTSSMIYPHKSLGFVRLKAQDVALNVVDGWFPLTGYQGLARDIDKKNRGRIRIKVVYHPVDDVMMPLEDKLPSVPGTYFHAVERCHVNLFQDAHCPPGSVLDFPGSSDAIYAKEEDDVEDAEPVDAEPVDAEPVDAKPVDANPVDALPDEIGPGIAAAVGTDMKQPTVPGVAEDGARPDAASRSTSTVSSSEERNSISSVGEPAGVKVSLAESGNYSLSLPSCERDSNEGPFASRARRREVALPRASNYFEEIYRAIFHARKLVYITGWSVDTTVRLLREAPKKPIVPDGEHDSLPPSLRDDPEALTGMLPLGELLKRKADAGVRVLLLVWDEVFSTNRPLLRWLTLMDTKDEETREFFRNTAVKAAVVPRIGRAGRVLKAPVVPCLFTFHEKLVITDVPLKVGHHLSREEDLQREDPVSPSSSFGSVPQTLRAMLASRVKDMPLPKRPHLPHLPDLGSLPNLPNLDRLREMPTQLRGHVQNRGSGATAGAGGSSGTAMGEDNSGLEANVETGRAVSRGSDADLARHLGGDGRSSRRFNFASHSGKASAQVTELPSPVSSLKALVTPRRQGSSGSGGPSTCEAGQESVKKTVTEDRVTTVEDDATATRQLSAPNAAVGVLPGGVSPGPSTGGDSPVPRPLFRRKNSSKAARSRRASSFAGSGAIGTSVGDALVSPTAGAKTDRGKSKSTLHGRSGRGEDLHSLTGPRSPSGQSSATTGGVHDVPGNSKDRLFSGVSPRRRESTGIIPALVSSNALHLGNLATPRQHPTPGAVTGEARQLTAFIGGLDLTYGRFDTPEHALFRTLQTSHKEDFHNACFDVGASAGPREPWHDVAANVTGPVVRDLVTCFEERWRRQGRGTAHLVDIASDSELHDGPFAHDEEQWTVQVFRSIDERSAVFGREEERLLETKKGRHVDRSIHNAYVHYTRAAKRYIYIEQQYFIGSSNQWLSDNHGDATNLVPYEMALKIAGSIRRGQPLRVYIVIPMWPEGVASDSAVQKILFFQFKTVEMMYRMVGDAIAEVGLDDAHPTDYLNFFCLGNREMPQTTSPVESEAGGAANVDLNTTTPQPGRYRSEDQVTENGGLEKTASSSLSPSLLPPSPDATSPTEPQGVSNIPNDESAFRVGSTPCPPGPQVDSFPQARHDRPPHAPNHDRDWNGKLDLRGGGFDERRGKERGISARWSRWSRRGRPRPGDILAPSRGNSTAGGSSNMTQTSTSLSRNGSDSSLFSVVNERLTAGPPAQLTVQFESSSSSDSATVAELENRERRRGMRRRRASQARIGMTEISPPTSRTQSSAGPSLPPSPLPPSLLGGAAGRRGPRISRAGSNMSYRSKASRQSSALSLSPSLSSSRRRDKPRAPRAGDEETLNRTRRHPIYQHAKTFIMDDEVIVTGSANLNERSMAGVRDSELAIGAFQPAHTMTTARAVIEPGAPSSTTPPLPRGEVARFRRRLFAEHAVGFCGSDGAQGRSFPAVLEDPGSLQCVKEMREIGRRNWEAYSGEEVVDLKSHLLCYPYEVSKTGEVTTPTRFFPDTRGAVSGTPSAIIPNILAS